MAWMWIGKDSNNESVYVNEERGIVAFDDVESEKPSADFEAVEFSTLEDVLNILRDNNVTCYR